MRPDLRDIGEPGEKEWQEFRASYSAAFLFVWLLSEMGDSIVTYVRELHSRFMTAWDIAALLDESHDEVPAVPLPNTLEDVTDNVWIDAAEAEQWYDQLFPHGDSFEDFRLAAHGLAVVALHSALEGYAKAIGVELRRTPLPRGIERYLEQKRAAVRLDSGTMQSLIDCDETRHLVVHHRSVVTERYANAVPYNRFLVGEIRRIRSQDLDRFAQIVWKSAETLRAAATPR